MSMADPEDQLRALMRVDAPVQRKWADAQRGGMGGTKAHDANRNPRPDRRRPTGKRGTKSLVAASPRE